ncbi:MAG: methionine adenosyltransferase [Planctomycetia bacterium]|nr:methionine adenosyltransferase [Planctomycetia bacterium]
MQTNTLSFFYRRQNVSQKGFLFTSEAVSMGHPDKLSDCISDGILDALFEQDPQSRVACETLVTTDLCVIAGEITTQAQVDYEAVARKVINEVGYTSNDIGFSGDTCKVDLHVHTQSPDIAMGVDRDGAGDQGLMFGYACTQTPELMPLPIALSHRIMNRLTEARQNGEVDWLLPDSKSQVTVEYADRMTPVKVTTVVVSTQHRASVDQKQIADWVIPNVILPCIPAELNKGDIVFHINPTGQFIVGGPHGDTGLTGRKIIVDTYGGWASHGGGAFSGKDPTKVDRSAAYMARYIAKNVVAAGLASDCEIQLAYAIGVADPVSICVKTYGSEKASLEQIEKAIRKVFPMTPKGIIETLQLRQPIFRKTASGGHFGRDGFPWEKTDKVDALKAAIQEG